MAGPTTKVIIVAQAGSGDVLQEGVILSEEHPTEGEHAPAGDTHGATDGHGTTAEAGHAGPKVFPPFDPSTFASQILWLVLTFAFLYVLLSRVAMPRIAGILESRRMRIEGDLKEADRLRLETERAAAAYDQALAEARANAHGIAEETRNGIKADIAGRRTAVETELSRKIAEAEARIQATKTAALANVDQIAIDTVSALVGQLTGPVAEQDARDAVAAVRR